MYKQCLEYYFRALELSPSDDHLYYNIARCYFEMKDFEKCKEYLQKALEINPELEEGKKFMEFLKKKRSGIKVQGV